MPAGRGHRRHHHRQRSRHDRAAPRRFGFKVYYGDGTRLDVLRAAGAVEARLVAICVDNREAASRIVDLVQAEFPGTKLYVRSFDRRHSLQLLAKNVDLEVRETYESALLFGRKTLEGLGLDPERAAAIEEFVRRRDLDRLVLQQAEGITAGLDLLRAQMAAGAVEQARARDQAAQSGGAGDRSPPAGRGVMLQ